VGRKARQEQTPTECQTEGEKPKKFAEDNVTIDLALLG
jgi:hypothetical protein